MYIIYIELWPVYIIDIDLRPVYITRVVASFRWRCHQLPLTRPTSVDVGHWWLMGQWKELGWVDGCVCVCWGGGGLRGFMAIRELSGSEPKWDDMPHTSPVLHPPADWDWSRWRWAVTIHLVVIIFTNSATKENMNRWLKKCIYTKTLTLVSTMPTLGEGHRNRYNSVTFNRGLHMSSIPPRWNRRHARLQTDKGLHPVLFQRYR